MSAAVVARLVMAVARRPRLWPAAVRQWRRAVPDRWWRHRPFLPVPPPEYVRFRLLTQYGDTRHAPTAADVVNYLTWCARITRP